MLVIRLPNESASSTWERLRLLYNGILAGVVLLTTLLDPARFLLPDFWGSAIFGGIAANLFFCMGVTLEYYLALIGADRRGARIFLFIVGTLFSMLLTFALTLLSINAFQLQGRSA